MSIGLALLVAAFSSHSVSGQTADPPIGAIAEIVSPKSPVRMDLRAAAITTVAPPATEFISAGETRMFLRQTTAAIARARRAFEYGCAVGVPSFKSGVWLERDVCPLGPLRLRKCLAKTHWANTYVADILNSTTHEPYRDVVVKHMNDCGNRLDQSVINADHPLLTDALFLSALSSTGLVPSPIYLSPAIRIPPDGVLPERVRTKVIEQRRSKCASVNTKTQFLVMERAGVDLSHYLRNLRTRLPWAQLAHRALSLIVTLIDMLRTIHDMGIIHGDIHGGNILFKNPGSAPLMNDTELVFIDFENADLLPTNVGAPVGAPRRSRVHPELLSFWHLRGYRVGRRDDVFRALELLAHALSLGAYYRELRENVEDGSSWGDRIPDSLYARFKQPKTLFYGVSPHSLFTDPEHKIREELDHIADAHLDALRHPDDRPEYQDIIAHLRVVQGLLFPGE